MSGKCRHGEVPGDGPSITVSGSRERACERHEERCRGAVLFNHWVLVWRVVCCATCGKKVC